MANAENTGPSLRDMAFAAAGGKRKSSNALVDAANKVFASYADQMADEALKRKAARERGETRKNRKAVDVILKVQNDKGFDPNKKNTTSEEVQDATIGDTSPSDAEIKVDNDPSMSYQQFLPTQSIPGMPMRSPIKQSLYGAAFAAAGGNRQDTKKTKKFIDDLAKAAIETRRTTQKILRDKVTKELENFSQEIVDLEGFNGFMNGKDAVTNFGIDLKQKIAEKKDAALKLNPYSVKYKETMAEINSLVESTKNLNLEQTRLKNLKKEWGTSSTESLYSKGSSKTTMHYLNQVMR
jgi:hypothetical protein